MVLVLALVARLGQDAAKVSLVCPLDVLLFLWLCQNENRSRFPDPQVIEVEVHNSLRSFLRSSGEPNWPHHLTMARLVARALRLGRSALMQTGIAAGSSVGRYRLSYLMPVLMWPEPAVVVATEEVLQRLLMVEIPQLQQWVSVSKPIRQGSCWPHPDFKGVLLMTPDVWLADRLSGGGAIPGNVPTIFDGVDDLESWAQQCLTVRLEAADWNELMLAFPDKVEEIRSARVSLTRLIYQHPPNPYECCLLTEGEAEILQGLFGLLLSGSRIEELPSRWGSFWRFWGSENSLLWAEVERDQGGWRLLCGPVEVARSLREIWPLQPVVLIGGAMDLDASASAYRYRVGLGELTCVKFAPDRCNQLIQLYLPDRLPLPNTPQYQGALLQQIRALLSAVDPAGGLVVLLVGDSPLKAIIGAQLAAEFGSRVQVEKTGLDENGILVTGWEFWRSKAPVMPAPQLLVISTLPVPSLENPLVAGRVAFYKQQRQDWFRLFLLPVALCEMQRAVAGVRDRQGVVALLDSRVLHRSYGSQVLSALSPLARIDYVDGSLFTAGDCEVLD